MAHETAVIADGVGKARTLKLAHTAAMLAGEIVVAGTGVMVAVNASDADTDNSYVFQGKAIMPKVTGTAFVPGDKCYWDDSARNITKTVGSNTLCGYCMEAAASAGTTIVVWLHPIRLETTDDSAQSKADSASVRASTADSKAVSNSVVISTNLSLGNSRAASNSVIASANLSTGDSKAVSNSALISTADSKAVSVSVISSVNLSTQVSRANSLSTLISTTESKLASHIAG